MSGVVAFGVKALWTCDICDPSVLQQKLTIQTSSAEGFRVDSEQRTRTLSLRM